MKKEISTQHRNLKGWHVIQQGKNEKMKITLAWLPAHVLKALKEHVKENKSASKPKNLKNEKQIKG